MHTYSCILYLSKKLICRVKLTCKRKMDSYTEEFYSSSDEESVSFGPLYAIINKRNSVEELKKENLTQILEKKNNATTKEEERIHYLQLELANKELVIYEMATKMEKLEKIVSLLNDYESAIKIVRSNISIYNDLISRVHSLDFGSIMRKEMLDIKEHSFVANLDVFHQTSKNTLLNSYISAVKEEFNLREEFYKKVNSYKHNTFYLLLGESLVGLLILIYYIYIKFFYI